VEPFSGVEEEGPSPAIGRVPLSSPAGPAGVEVSEGGFSLRGPPLLLPPESVEVSP